MKHFLNHGLLAPNVMTFPVDQSIVAEFRDLESLNCNFATVRPPEDWGSDIRWISAADEESFAIFQSAFDRMGIAAHTASYLDVKNQVRLYAGFLVVRQECHKLQFHVDWVNTNNEAFSCLTPVSADPAGFGLAYKKLTGEAGEYDYKTGEAIAFGDHFNHATKPGKSQEPVVLLCFEYGSDRMEHWPKIYETVGYQVTHLRRPDGAFVEASAKAVRADSPGAAAG